MWSLMVDEAIQDRVESWPCTWEYSRRCLSAHEKLPRWMLCRSSPGKCPYSVNRSSFIELSSQLWGQEPEQWKVQSITPLPQHIFSRWWGAEEVRLTCSNDHYSWSSVQYVGEGPIPWWLLEGEWPQRHPNWISKWHSLSGRTSSLCI